MRVNRSRNHFGANYMTLLSLSVILGGVQRRNFHGSSDCLGENASLLKEDHTKEPIIAP
jgi:hypothetical protein